MYTLVLRHCRFPDDESNFDSVDPPDIEQLEIDYDLAKDPVPLVLVSAGGWQYKYIGTEESRRSEPQSSFTRHVGYGSGRRPRPTAESRSRSRGRRR